MTQLNRLQELIEDETEITESDSSIYILRLYFAGQTPKSVTAFANLKKIYDEHLEEGTRLRL